MNKPKKCKNCQWYGKPYWSIINPCDSCPNENDNMTIVQIDGVPVFKEAITEEQLKEKSIFEITIEEKDKEIDKLNNRIHALEKHNEKLQQEAQKYFDLLMECEYKE